MKTLSAFGMTIEPDFWGDFDNATVKDNVAPSARTAAIQPTRGGEPCEVGWIVPSDGGERGVYVRYASPDERPCELVVNGEIIQSRALFEATESIKMIDWRFQAPVTLIAGENRISIRSPGALPEIYALAVAPVPVATQLSVDDYHALLSAERASTETRAPFILEPHRFRGMIEAMRSMVTDDAAVRRLSSVVGLAVTRGQAGTINGQAWMPWGGPLNGQRFRQQIFARLLRVGADAIIETGTYLGASTAFFARQGLPVHTCESQEEYFATALAHLVDHSNVKLYLQDSRAFLRGLAEDPMIGYKCPIFYLDAHWYNDLPLADEIKIIRQRWPRFMIMVDDFQVPEASYGFDRYPNGLELTLDYLRKEGVALDTLAVLFPTAAHTAETSVRRGTLVLTSSDIYDAHLIKERTLYRYAT